MRKFKVVIEKDPDEEMYTVTVPRLPGCVSQGTTKEEALVRIKELLR
jgi:predicted RNase H-like HicB family nuclease